MEVILVLDSSEMLTLFMASGSDWSSLASVEASSLETFGLGTFTKITKFLARDFIGFVSELK